MLTRGVEGRDIPTGWAFGAVSPDHTPARTQGIRIVLLDRGVRHDVAQTSPWLLAGAKSLSYAVNRAAFREAARRDADDALFVSSDGYLLEGAVSNLVLRTGTRLTTPRTDLGILEGTTQHDIFTWAESQGYETSYELLTPDDLAAADAAWLVSSVRHAAPIRSVDGVERAGRSRAVRRDQRVPARPDGIRPVKQDRPRTSPGAVTGRFRLRFTDWLEIRAVLFTRTRRQVSLDS